MPVVELPSRRWDRLSQLRLAGRWLNSCSLSCGLSLDPLECAVSISDADFSLGPLWADRPACTLPQVMAGPLLPSAPQNAVRVPRDFEGCSVLRKYLGQLHYLQSRVPMGSGQEAAVPVTW